MSNYNLFLSRKLFYAVCEYLRRYDDFLKTGSVEANKACNNAIERLRDVIAERDSCYE